MTKKIENIKLPNQDETDKMWNNISSRIEKNKKYSIKVRSSIAAVILLFLSLGFLLGYNEFLKPRTYQAAAGKTIINLRDGSQVQLLKGGKLIVSSFYFSKERKVYLDGDALFKISKSKDHPFVVATKNYETKVIGTVFTIFQNNDNFKLHLFEGKVAVKKNSDPNYYYLAPAETMNNFGDMDAITILKSKKIPVNQYKREDNNSMLTADLFFSECKVKNALSIIENIYGIKIEYPAEYANETFSGDLKNESIETILESLSFYLNLNLIKNGQNFKLEK